MAMQEPTFFILTALAGEPLHGYAVMQTVNRISDGRLTLRPGTLYTALDRLTADGLIEVDREEIADSRMRRYYRLTDSGAAALAADAARLSRNAETALGRLRDHLTPASARPALER
jgi:DNA-binding PadR family transcriptional regulator